MFHLWFAFYYKYSFKLPGGGTKGQCTHQEMDRLLCGGRKSGCPVGVWNYGGTLLVWKPEERGRTLGKSTTCSKPDT